MSSFHYIHPKVTVRAIKRSISQIVVVSFWFFMMILVSSGIIYYLERGYFDENSKAWFRVDPSNGQVEKSPFQSIIHAFYWGVITLTTTGYGDEVPFTSWGKFFTCVTVICGVLIVAMPTSILGSSFVAEWTLHQRAHSLGKPRQLIKKSDNPHVALAFRNDELLAAISEVQEKLADVNPTRYYQKLKICKCSMKMRWRDIRVGSLVGKMAACSQLRKI